MHNLQQFDEAEKTIQKGIELDAASPLGFYYLGGPLLPNGSSMTVPSAYFEKSIALQPDFEAAHLGIASLYESQGEWAKAAEKYRLYSYPR